MNDLETQPSEMVAHFLKGSTPSSDTSAGSFLEATMKRNLFITIRDLRHLPHLIRTGDAKARRLALYELERAWDVIEAFDEPFRGAENIYGTPVTLAIRALRALVAMTDATTALPFFALGDAVKIRALYAERAADAVSGAVKRMRFHTREAA